MENNVDFVNLEKIYNQEKNDTTKNKIIRVLEEFIENFK